MPMERPDVLGGDRVGKHRAVAVELQPENGPDDHEQQRPAKAGGDDGFAKQFAIGADIGRGRWREQVSALHELA